MGKYYSVKYMKYFCHLSYIFGLMPFYNFDGKIQYAMTAIYKSFLVILVITFQVISAGSFYYIVTQEDNYKLPATQWVLLVVNLLLVTVMNITTFVETYFRRYQWLNFIDKLVYIDHQIGFVETFNAQHIIEFVFGCIIGNLLFLFKVFTHCIYRCISAGMSNFFS